MKPLDIEGEVLSGSSIAKVDRFLRWVYGIRSDGVGSVLGN